MNSLTSTTMLADTTCIWQWSSHIKGSSESYEVLQKVTSGSKMLFCNKLKIEDDFTKYSRDSCCSYLINISPRNMFLIMLLPARFHKNGQGAFGHSEY